MGKYNKMRIKFRNNSSIKSSHMTVNDKNIYTSNDDIKGEME